MSDMDGLTRKPFWPTEPSHTGTVGVSGSTGATGATYTMLNKGQIVRINILPNDLKEGDRINFLSQLNVKITNFHDNGAIDVVICEEPPPQKLAGSTG